MAIIKIRNAAIDLDAAEIPNLPATKITSGTFDNARISLDAAEIPNLDTAKITTGTLADARVPDLNASKITAGTIATARLGSGTASSSTFLRGDNTFNAPPNTGITEVDMWRLSTYYTGYQDPINANWERADTSGFSYKGTGLTQSSGVFSFPSTGFYKIDFNWSGNSQTDTRNIGAGIAATENNSSYSNLGYNSTFLQRTNSDATYLSININVIFKVDNITTHKIRFWGGAANINAAPDTNSQVVGFTCFRLTDI